MVETASQMTPQSNLVQSMTAPLQAAPPEFAQREIQARSMASFNQYQQQLEAERQKSADLAMAMRKGAMQAGASAINSAAKAASDAADMKQINSAGRIQARHPLDLLAIGIRGWKARKADKAGRESAAQAKQDALIMAEANRKAEKAEEYNAWVRKEQFKNSKPPEAIEPTQARAVYAYDVKTAEYENNGVPEDQRVYNDFEKAGQIAAARNNKRSAMSGGIRPAPARSKADTSKDVEAIRKSERTFQKLTKDIVKYSPEYQGVGGWMKGAYGSALDSLGVSPEGESVKFSSDRAAFRSGLYSFANVLIKERSGAAVTKQEFDRFLKEFALGEFTGQIEFEKKMDAFINKTAEENYMRMRQSGWRRDRRGALVRDERVSEPIVGGYNSVNDQNFWEDFNTDSQNLPEELFDADGEFYGFRRKGDMARNPEKYSTQAQQSGQAQPSPEDAANAYKQAREAMSMYKDNPEGQDYVRKQLSSMGLDPEGWKP